MASPALLERVEVEPPGPADAAVIWLHGLGADGHDFPPIVPELGLPEGHGVRFVFPHAPQRPVTINGGMLMRAWYDILSLDFERRADAQGVEDSCRRTSDLIAAEVARGIPNERIVLAGFSQGGAIALHLGVRHPERLAGIVALSTYLPVPGDLAAEGSAANRAVAIFQAHGTLDPMVTFDRGTRARDALLAAGYDVAWSEYPMQHQVCLEEIEALGAWLRDRLAL
ncbi:MAG: alpha/beta fold hydrolase [Planctomycetota bacterium]|nr:alpha/beta fold hydrolase [Planctomycetota bacterium]